MYSMLPTFSPRLNLGLVVDLIDPRVDSKVL